MMTQRMLVRNRRPAALVALLVIASATGCGPHGSQPCYGVQAGDRLSITVVEQYDSTTHYGPSVYEQPAGCGFGLDVVQGQVLTATAVAGASGTDCSVATPVFDPAAAWSWADAGALGGEGGGDVLAGSYQLQSAQCSGLVQLEFHVVSGDPFEPSVPGEVPHVVMYRFYYGGTSSETGCVSCQDTYVVSLTKG
jgi:hypothetical protein